MDFAVLPIVRMGINFNAILRIFERNAALPPFKTYSKFSRIAINLFFSISSSIRALTSSTDLPAAAALAAWRTVKPRQIVEVFESIILIRLSPRLSFAMLAALMVPEVLNSG